MGITLAFGGISTLAIVFLGKFLSAICKERRHVRICMLLTREDCDLDGWGGDSEIALETESRIVPVQIGKALSFLHDAEQQQRQKVG